MELKDVSTATNLTYVMHVGLASGVLGTDSVCVVICISRLNDLVSVLRLTCTPVWNVCKPILKWFTACILRSAKLLITLPERDT